MTMTLNWIKCTDDKWCDFLSVNLSHSHFDGMEGVYLIWHGGDQPHTVRVGQGVIRDRIAEHRQDSDVLAFRNLGLFVTWASVPSNQRDGVERFLGDKLSPKVGLRLPDVVPIPVNLPW
jgi:hypothetical protein